LILGFPRAEREAIPLVVASEKGRAQTLARLSAFSHQLSAIRINFLAGSRTLAADSCGSVL